MTVDELKNFLNIDEDNKAHNETLADLIAAASEDLFLATGKNLNEDNPLVRQYIKLYARREFDTLSDSGLDTRLLDIQKKILLSIRYEEAGQNAQSG